MEAVFSRGLARQRATWWHDPAASLAHFAAPDEQPLRCELYRIADCLLAIESADVLLQTRFQQLYGECAATTQADFAQRVCCRVRSCPRVPAYLVTFTPADDLELFDFILALFVDRGYVELDGGFGDWRLLGMSGCYEPLLAALGNQALVNPTMGWQAVVGNCAINWAMRLQRGFLFFHAGSVAIDGVGVMLAGNKGAGKSTLTLALAALGYDFLGDEIAAVRTRTRELVPFRRAVGVRPGPQSSRVEVALQSALGCAETYPDGGERVRVEASALFPHAGARPSPLRHVFWLCDFEEHPRVERFVPGFSDLSQLAPLACTYWRSSPARPMMQVASWFSDVKSFRLYPGMPDETAALIERIARTE
jgi:hypothetical protein